MKEKLQQLKAHLRTINDLQSAAAVLNWDSETYMPESGAPARARQLGTLQRLAHERFVSDEFGQLLEDLMNGLDSLPEDSDDAALVRLTHRDFTRARQVPPDRLAAMVEHGANTYPVWAKARAEDDFGIVRANLEKTLDFSREIAGYFEGFEHIADPLIEFSDPGMTVKEVRAVFSDLREQLVPLVAAIAERPLADDSSLHQLFPEKDQQAFGISVVEKLGFDHRRNRQDKTHHPFMTKFSLGDIRITTRFNELDFSDGFFSTVHETGHALYEMGINPDYEATPLASGTSAGAHESQSRLWENIVGRSRPFWEHFYPQAREAFPVLADVPLDTFYRAINRVEPSLIRTDADEVTYNLHVMIRFELELEMLEGNLLVRDLPQAWRERYQAYLGVSSPTDKNGVLQDVHWYAGVIGGSFQGYALGNIMAAQFYAAAERANPDLQAEFRRGKFDSLHGWLIENIYRYGSKYTASELLARVTGSGLDTRPLMDYLNSKFGALYNLS